MTISDAPPTTRQRARELAARSNSAERKTSETLEALRQEPVTIEPNSASESRAVVQPSEEENQVIPSVLSATYTQHNPPRERRANLAVPRSTPLFRTSPVMGSAERHSADEAENNPADTPYPRPRFNQQSERTGQLPERWESELHHLSTAMNTMMESVKQSQDRQAELIQQLIANQISQHTTTPPVATLHREANWQATPQVNSLPGGTFTAFSSKAKPRSPDEFSGEPDQFGWIKPKPTWN